MSRKILLIAAFAVIAGAGPAYAQAPAAQPQPAPAPAPQAAPAPAPAPQYGALIGLDDARKIAAVAIAEVGKIGSNPMAIAIVDSAGYLVHFERMDNTQYGSNRVAIDKARSAALFRRPSKAFEDALAGGRTAILALRGALPVEGGVPIMAGGKVVGAIGASGGTAAQDGQVAAAGIAALGK
jgi:glc operon protein GlcG